MIEQAFFSSLFFFSLYVGGKFLIGLYREHIGLMDDANVSLRKMADNLEEQAMEKRRRAEELAKRKLEADKRRAYEKGRREAMDSGNVTPLRPVNSYAAAKNGDFPLNREQPVEYDRAQEF